jgi:hypothetical protein
MVLRCICRPSARFGISFSNLPKPEAARGLVCRRDESAMQRSRPEMLVREPLTRTQYAQVGNPVSAVPL